MSISVPTPVVERLINAAEAARAYVKIVTANDVPIASELNCALLAARVAVDHVHNTCPYCLRGRSICRCGEGHLPGSDF